MNEFYDFLNQQSGDRLLGYGVIFLISLRITAQLLYLIFDSISSAFKNRKKRNDEKNIN